MENDVLQSFIRLLILSHKGFLTLVFRKISKEQTVEDYSQSKSAPTIQKKKTEFNEIAAAADACRILKVANKLVVKI